MTGATVQGAERLMRQLRNLEGPGAKRALGKAARAGTAVLAKAVKAATPVDEGLLRRAETSKVSVKGLTAWGGAGADIDKLNAQAQASAGKRPTNLDWLVEYGHLAPDGTFVPPSGFMRRAETQAMPAAEAAFTSRLATEIEIEASK